MLMATVVTVAKLEAAQGITDRGLDKQVTVCTDNGGSSSLYKGNESDMQYSVGEP